MLESVQNLEGHNLSYSEQDSVASGKLRLDFWLGKNSSICIVRLVGASKPTPCIKAGGKPMTTEDI